MEPLLDTASRRGRLRDALTDAAVASITSQGLSGLKARALADAAGCAVGAIYNVVSDLDELILLVNARTLVALAATLGSGRKSGRGPDWAIAELVELALAYLDFAAAHRQLWRALFDHRLPAGRDLPSWYRDEQQHLFDYVERPLAELQPAAAPARRALLARSLFSAVHGLVALGLEEKLQPIPLPVLREQVTTMVTALGYGLAGGE
jgi:AcrR family transcriptional regulator